MSNKLARAALLMTYRVADFDRWYEVFNAFEAVRREGGIAAHHVNRIRGDENHLSVFLAVEDIEAARRFRSSEVLRTGMQKAGVQGSPETLWLKPRSQDIIWDRELPAIIVRHEVKDFLHWKRIFDAAAAVRDKYGIIGHATNTLLDDDKTVIVYHQAESFKALDTFLANPELKESMDLAGVLGEPEVVFSTGGWAKAYTSPEVSPADRKKTDSTHTHI